MRTVLQSVTAGLAFVAMVVGALALDLVSQEFRARIERLPYAIAKLATRRVPADLRDEVYQVLRGDLAYELSNEAGSGPITRLINAHRSALSVLLRRAGTRTAKELYAYAPPRVEGFEDIRQLSRRRRKRFAAITARLKELCNAPADQLDETASARLASAIAVACEALVSDRAERLAADLAAPFIGGVHPLVARLGVDHPAMMDIRRTHAHARLELGDARADRLLRELHLDEARLYGHDDPRTFATLQLYWWAVARAGRLSEAEAGLLSLEDRMVRLPKSNLPLLRHIQCKRSWIQGELGKKQDALSGYREVTAGRSRELGPNHGDTLHARHSVGKMLVRCGDRTRASEVLRSVLAERRRLQGSHHPDTLETKKYLALANLGQGVLARWRLRRRLHHILMEQVRVRGADHPDTQDTQRWLDVLAAATEES